MAAVPPRVKVQAPAKINLFLHVTGRRDDGYHELFTLMCRVGLFDTLALEFGSPEIVVTCGDPSVPEDETNLAHLAAVLFFEAMAPHGGRRARGVRIAIDKQIPVAAGLGGGSSDAAAVLLALNRRYDRCFSDDELAVLALGIGADVPFFLHSQPAFATGVGERLRTAVGLAPQKIVMVFPGHPVSTAEVFKNLNLALTKEKKKPKYSLLNVQKLDIKRHLHNDLEPVALAMHPGIGTVKSRLLAHGALGALMSGSGPTVFGLFRDDRAAQTAYRALLDERVGRVFLVDMPI